jgi:DNA-binding CsgD family transcriptional regulator
MPETDRKRTPKSAALRIIDVQPPLWPEETPPQRRSPPADVSRTGPRGGPVSHVVGEEMVSEDVPLACFCVEGRQCEVVCDGAPTTGREVVGSLAVGGRSYLVLGAEAEPEVPDLMVVLTKRELDIAVLVSRGWDAKAIGRRLDISFHTVRVHTGRIYAKLHMHKQSELVACVARQSWHRK